MRYNRRYSKPTPRTITVKFAGKCICCGAPIAAGEIATFYPAGTIASIPTGQIGHTGGLEGNSAKCAGNLRQKDFIDIDRMYEDQCADICGR